MGLEREISRTVSFKTSRGRTVRGMLHKVSRRHVVFEIYDPSLVLRTSEVLSGFQVRRGRDALYQGEAVITNVVNTAILLVVSATLSGSWLGLEDTALAVTDIESDARAFVETWNQASRISPRYQLRVGNLKTFLNDLRYWLDQIDLTRDHANASNSQNSALTDGEFTGLMTSVMPQLTELCMGLEDAIRESRPSATDTHKAFAQRELLPLLMPSPFFNRIYTKPLGYAGDYEMVNMMFRNEAAGLTTFARAVDAWMLAGPPSEAHRNRIKILQEVLSDVAASGNAENRPVRILNIGCGPAHELQTFLANSKHTCRFEIDLLDFNAETLAFAREKLTPLAEARPQTTEITYNLRSVQDLLRQAIERTNAKEPYQLVYCAGLFDYLTDRVCSKLVRLFYDWCAPGGRVFVTNVHAGNPVKGLMEHVMEWHLVLRDEPGMLRLSPDPENSKIYTDTTGINVFLEVHKSFSMNATETTTAERLSGR